MNKIEQNITYSTYGIMRNILKKNSELYIIVKIIQKGLKMLFLLRSSSKQ